MRTPTLLSAAVGLILVSGHTSEAEGLDKNFAGLFPFIDLAFGTFYMPPGRQPHRFEILGDPVPDGLLRQIVHPFRTRRRRA